MGNLENKGRWRQEAPGSWLGSHQPSRALPQASSYCLVQNGLTGRSGTGARLDHKKETVRQCRRIHEKESRQTKYLTRHPPGLAYLSKSACISRSLSRSHSQQPCQVGLEQKPPCQPCRIAFGCVHTPYNRFEEAFRKATGGKQKFDKTATNPADSPKQLPSCRSLCESKTTTSPESLPIARPAYRQPALHLSSFPNRSNSLLLLSVENASRNIPSKRSNSHSRCTARQVLPCLVSKI